jgi:hypothetical protein
MRNKKLVLCIFLIILVNLTIVISEEITDSSCAIPYDSTYNEEEDLYQDGEIEIPLDCAVDFKFEDVLIQQTLEEDQRIIGIFGQGRVEGESPSEREKIYGVEEESFIVTFTGDLLLDDSRTIIEVSNLEDVSIPSTKKDVGWSMTSTLIENIHESIIGNSPSRGDLIIGVEGEGTITIEDATEVLFSEFGVECRSCTYIIDGNPTIGVIGSRFYNEAANLDYVSESSIEINGKEHIISGRINFEGGHFQVPADSQSMIDGVYIKAEEEVKVYLDQETGGSSENYISMGDDTLELNGDGFTVALGTGQGGRPTEDFEFEMTTKSDYISDDEEYGRLVFEMTGGNVVLDSSAEKIQVNEAGVEVLNGVNKISYVEEDGELEFNYQYVGCGSDLLQEQRSALGAGTGELVPVDETTSLCSEVGLLMQDGGLLNVETYVPERETHIEEVIFENKGTTGRVGQDTYSLDTNKVYVLGYKGGQAADQVAFGSNSSLKQWGHVGMLYNRGGSWWISESDGRNAKIIPPSESLFGEDQNLDGVFEVLTNYPEQIIQEMEEMVGAPYDKASKTNPSPTGIYCSNLVIRALEGAEDITDSEASFYDLYMSDENTDLAALIGNLGGAILMDTPGEVINSPHLREVDKH